MATVVEGNQKAPFSIATTLRYREDTNPFSGLLHYISFWNASFYDQIRHREHIEKCKYHFKIFVFFFSGMKKINYACKEKLFLVFKRDLLKMMLPKAWNISLNYIGQRGWPDIVWLQRALADCRSPMYKMIIMLCRVSNYIGSHHDTLNASVKIQDIIN